MNAALKKKIDEFLKHRRRSDGGWAKITTDDVTQLENIVRLLVMAKCSPDADGDRPIEFMIVNRRTHNSVSYSALPYHTWQRSDDDLPPPVTEAEIMDLAMLNLELASNDVHRLYRGIREERRVGCGQDKDTPEKPEQEAPAGQEAGYGEEV